ncbi:organic solute transporter Ostalpha-domain-containing protein [Lipomyces oligophaga]|uniref:organic solute transporter Ostalpha-domain-containing protein n=1 Tax=Lipomyces oligophaga TaxID=45792 RepID=UPI0034CD9D53
MSDLSGLPNWLTQTTGTFAFSAAGVSCASIYMHLRNYRKPLRQRFVVRIQLLIPIYALSCWFNLTSHRIAMFIDPLRDIYEAFVLYQFFWLLTNYLGGERGVIIMMSGQPPREHLVPFFRHFLQKIDISDPHDFLAIKRGILQYTWLKPVFACIVFLLKLAGVYQEGFISWTSGYFWMGLLYNLSVSLALYCLALFWVCLSVPLQPFRPMPKFLCIKLLLFASFWQGFALSLLVFLGIIKDVGYYTPNNVARVVQNSLMCLEMLAFAFGHWSAFSWKEYVDNSVGSARLPIYYAFRDAFGMLDVVEDIKDTLRGEQYQYRAFDSAGAIEHPDSASREARLRAGLRYQQGGAAKYWLPQPSSVRKSLPKTISTAVQEFFGYSSDGQIALPISEPSSSRSSFSTQSGDSEQEEDDWIIDYSTEELYKLARKLEYGDYNYPVITVQQPLTYVPYAYKDLRAPASVTASVTPSTAWTEFRAAPREGVTSSSGEVSTAEGTSSRSVSRPGVETTHSAPNLGLLVPLK